MPPPLNTDRSKTVAYTAPLILFLGLQFLIPAFKIENPELPLWRSLPESWIYPLQTFVCLALLIVWRRQFQFGKPHLIGFGILMGLVGIAIWLAPVELGWQDRSTGGFDSTLLSQGLDPVESKILLSLRFLRLVVVVPLIEEIFWRGFLMRWLIDSPKPWHKIELGTYSHKSFWINTLMIGLAHAGPDFRVALIWGALIGFVTVRSKNLWAPIAAHATANLVLGIYVMKTGASGLW